MTTASDTTERPNELNRVMGPGLLLLFIVGDILGTGIYALTGVVAKEVGGVVWLPFLVAFIVATITAFSYLELVTKYPQAAGAALYTHRAFGIHFLTFLVAFTVMTSGITSASTAARAFAENMQKGFGLSNSAALTTVLAICFMLLVAAVFRRSVREAFHDIRIRVARINSFLQEHLSGMRVVQLFGREEVTAREFAVINKDHLSAHLRSITVYALFFPAVEFLGSVALGALLWYGGLRVLDQTLTVGVLAAFIQLTRRFFQPLQDLAEKYNLLQSAMASSERIFRLMDTQPTVLEPVHPKRLARPFRGEVVFEDVWFRYGGDRVPGSEFRVAESDEATSNEPGTRNPELPTDNWVLKGVSFTARPDQTLAIVGHTGAGKTTIISLLLRFYDPQRGRITLDGVDLRELPLAQLRELVGFVQQDLFLFTGNILHNLTLDAPISPERAHEAAARVGADRFINRLPDTYAHILGERGRNLSVGERQLLSFARALARDPRILVLDEATSSVDAEAEAQIQAALAELMKGRTTLVVAHRLSTILHANEILVLHHGEVAERGSHRELLARKGLYERLYRLQLRGPTREHRVGV